MMYTLREIANKLNLNKVTVFKHYKQLKRDNAQLMREHTKSYKNRILLDNRAYSELVSSFNHLHINVNRNINYNSKLMIIKLLKSELHDKDNRINKLDNQLVNMNKELQHQQELQLNEQRRNQSLTKSLEYTKRRGKSSGFLSKLKNFFK